MRRLAVVACALGLWASPVAAQSLQLAPPTLTARADRCTAQLRTLCQGNRQRALETDLSCADCGPAPMPADVVAPASTTGPDRPRGRSDCAPTAGGPLPQGCAAPPRLDYIPRP